MRVLRIALFCSCIIWVMIISSCSKMDDSYRDFIEGGEIIYTGKADSVKTFSGKNRIKLTMLLLSDPKITKVKVFWNDRMDSAVQNIVRSSGVDTITFLLENMPEGSYNFQIYTYDNQGHSSVKTEAIGIVYGQNYINSLFNRPLRSANYFAPTRARLIWFGPSAQNIGQQVNYTDSLGVARIIYVPRLQDTTILNNFKRLESFQYRTMYKPDMNAIDTFYSAFETRQVQ